MRALAAALTRSPYWTQLPSAVLAARAHPHPLLVALGDFGRVDQVRLDGLSRRLEFALAHPRYYDWSAVEESVVRLASKLTNRLGTDRLTRFRFSALPRGGLIVLGLLAYALGLSREQLTAPDQGSGTDAPLVVVDDCALTGARFRHHLAGISAPEVVFAPLAAHPDLCRAIEAAESRVTACIPGDELYDWAPELYGEGYTAWRSGWAQRKAGQSYWGGLPEYIGFPWSEPETSFWNIETGEMEPGWDLLPSELCLKHRSPSGAPEDDSLQLCIVGPGPLRPADTVVWGRINDAVIVAGVASVPEAAPGACMRLDGTAADMWEALLEHGTVDAATEALLRLYEVDRETLRGDLAGFVTTLKEEGILSGA